MTLRDSPCIHGPYLPPRWSGWRWLARRLINTFLPSRWWL